VTEMRTWSLFSVRKIQSDKNRSKNTGKMPRAKDVSRLGTHVQSFFQSVNDTNSSRISCIFAADAHDPRCVGHPFATRHVQTVRLTNLRYFVRNLAMRSLTGFCMTIGYRSLAYSALASFRMGMSGSALSRA